MSMASLLMYGRLRKRRHDSGHDHSFHHRKQKVVDESGRGDELEGDLEDARP